MSDEVTIAMARDVAGAPNKMSEALRHDDPHGYIAGVGLMLVSVVEQRDRLRAELSASEARNMAAYGEMAELRAELSRYRAWHDAVMAQDAVMSRDHRNGGPHDLIIRPQPLEVKP